MSAFLLGWVHRRGIDEAVAGWAWDEGREEEGKTSEDMMTGACLLWGVWECIEY